MPRDIDEIAMKIFKQVCPEWQGAVMLFPKPPIDGMRSSGDVTSEVTEGHILINGSELYAIIKKSVKNAYAKI